MSSNYSVIQYVPNPIADERINIGVIAFDDRTVLVHFLKNWGRVSNFGGEDITFLQEFAQWMEESVKSGLLFPGNKENGTPRYAPHCKRVTTWHFYAPGNMNSIQFSEPRGSLLDVEALFQETIETYLVDKPIDKTFTIELISKRDCLLGGAIESRYKVKATPGTKITIETSDGSVTLTEFTFNTRRLK